MNVNRKLLKVGAIDGTLHDGISSVLPHPWNEWTFLTPWIVLSPTMISSSIRIWWLNTSSSVKGTKQFSGRIYDISTLFSLQQNLNNNTSSTR